VAFWSLLVPERCSILEMFSVIDIYPYQYPSLFPVGPLNIYRADKPTESTGSKTQPNRGPTSFVTQKDRQLWANRILRAKGKPGWDKPGTDAWKEYADAMVGKYLYLFEQKARWREDAVLPTLEMLEYKRRDLLSSDMYDEEAKKCLEHLARLIGKELGDLRVEPCLKMHHWYQNG
jgi:hypothetical protein